MRDLLLRAIYAAPSTLSLIPFQDALGTRERINVPGETGAAQLELSHGADRRRAHRRPATKERLSRLASETGREPARVKS